MSSINISVYPLDKTSQATCFPVTAELKELEWNFNYCDTAQLTTEKNSTKDLIKKEVQNCDLLILVGNLNYPSTQRKIMQFLSVAKQLGVLTIVFSIAPIMLLNWSSKYYVKCDAYKEDREIGTLQGNFEKTLSKTVLIQLQSGLSDIDAIDYDVNDFYDDVSPVYQLDFSNDKRQNESEILAGFYARFNNTNLTNIDSTPLINHYFKKFSSLSTSLVLAIKALLDPLTKQGPIGIDFADYRLAFERKGLYQTKLFTQELLLASKENNERWFQASTVVVTIFLKANDAIKVFNETSLVISNMLEKHDVLWLFTAVIEEHCFDNPVISITYKP
ncbi:hypothetical protein [Colwellia sp. E2M01]|uniref:hypothetical protein n=1 Tax=Colwellia sp. E2M01 TaxID=2841561 RepID=UPI001C0929B6|nr:hypothetical protein [Colwellia sp. E2M01]MBU2872121.1 hypothetical protein [Colwellia sp. E2M01]